MQSKAQRCTGGVNKNRVIGRSGGSDPGTRSADMRFGELHKKPLLAEYRKPTANSRFYFARWPDHPILSASMVKMNVNVDAPQCPRLPGDDQVGTLGVRAPICSLRGDACGSRVAYPLAVVVDSDRDGERARGSYGL